MTSLKTTGKIVIVADEDFGVMTYYVTALSYEQALELIKDLKKVQIDAYITVGGVSIYVDAEDEKALLDVCAKFNTVPHSERPFAQRLVLDKEKTLDELKALGAQVD